MEGGGAASAYTIPLRMDSSSFLAQEAAWAQGSNGGATSGGNAPLYGNGSSGSGGGSNGGGGSADAMPGGSVGAYTNWSDPSPLPTATPGYGGSGMSYASGRGASITSIRLQLVTPVYLDGKAIAQIVTAYQAQQHSNAGSVGVPRSSYQ